MSKILRIALVIAFIIVFYTGELVGILFDYRGINVVPTPTWILLLFTTCAANVASAFWISRADPPRNLAFWGLFLKVCFLPIFLADFYIFVLMRSWFPPSPEVSPLGFFLIAPYVVLSCPLMIVSSCYGFAAIDRARRTADLPWKGKKVQMGACPPHRRPRRSYLAVRTLAPPGRHCSNLHPGRRPALTRAHYTPTRCQHRRHPRYKTRTDPQSNSTPLAYSPAPRSLTLFHHCLLRWRACHHDLSPSISDTSNRRLVPRHVCVRPGDYR